ncbi:MAG: 2-isopropylmalate synthase, partial [Pseudomonadota bacterium]
MEEWVRLNSSPLNFMAEVRNEAFLPSKVFIHDTTLRDGEQFAGVVFNREDKVRLGQALSEYGVHRIELMPAVSDEDFEAASKLNSMGLSAEIVGFCRSVKGDIEKAAQAGCRAIQMEMTAWPRLLEAFGWSFDQATGKMIEASHFAKEKGLRVSGFFMLVTQAEPDFSERFIKKVLAEGTID